jgi:hypothetical protein
MNPLRKISCGTSTGFWKNLSAAINGGTSPRILLHVNTVNESFRITPQYYITLFGNNGYWMISTDHSVRNATEKGFDVVLSLPGDMTVEELSSGRQSSFAEFANSEAWGVYWYAIQPTFRAPEIQEMKQALR